MEAQLEIKIKELFGEIGWHTYTELERKDKRPECYWCKGDETKKALVNIWGNVHQVGACDQCYDEYHGTRRDDL